MSFKRSFIIKLHLFVIFLINGHVIDVFAQNNDLGTPFIQNYSPQEYSYESQVFSIVQDEKGILYFGSLNGIIEYDGANWDIAPINGEIKLAQNEQGAIFCGGYNQIAYLDEDSVQFINVSSGESIEVGQIDKIIANDKVVFTADNKLYCLINNVVKLVSESSSSFGIFKVKGAIYVYRHEEGLLLFDDDELRSLPQGDWFIGKSVIELLQYEEQLLVKTKQDKGFFVYDFETIEPFYTQADEFLHINNFTKGVQLSNGNYALGTSRGGVVIIDRQGRVVSILNKYVGLSDDYIFDLYADASNNLWVALNNGISRIEFPSAFSYFNKNSGIKGKINSICRHNENIYLATSQGVYYLDNQDEQKESKFGREKFSPVKGIAASCLEILSLEDKLYVFSNNGVFVIQNEIEGELVLNADIHSFYQSVVDSTLFFAGSKQGVKIFKYKDGKWIDKGNIKRVNRDIQSIAQSKDGVLWLGTNYDGVFRVVFSEDESKDPAVIHLNQENSIFKETSRVYVYSTINGVLFSTRDGVFRFDANKFKFYLDTSLGFDFTEENVWAYPMVEDRNHNLWMSINYQDRYEKNTCVTYFQGEGQSYYLLKRPFNRIKNFTVEAIYPDENSIVWFGGYDGLVRYDAKFRFKDTTNYHSYIREISIEEDSVIYHGKLKEGAYNEFTSEVNTIHFKYSAPLFRSDEKLYYQTFLEGFDSKWSEWSHSNIKEYTNLPDGKYVFNVRAKDIYGNISREAEYSFLILPPIYKSAIAYVAYILLIILFIIMAVRWREYIFAVEKHRLAKIIKERTEDLVRQKERAEELVANILPKDTAKELQTKGRASRKKFEMTTVLFSDIQGFTKIAEHMQPELLLDELDKFFFHFDSVVDRLGIEKIKTIGDAYMCAGGIPQKNRTNPIDVVMSGIEMQHFMAKLRKESQNDWGIRIGIHTGPVIAGVVGSKKLSYDIWGDSVNIASRMESTGEIGQINVSEVTYELIKDFFDCEYRGKLPVKYKGDIDMYFVKGIKSELSIKKEGKEPNAEFFKRLQYIRFRDLDELIMTKLQKGLPKNLYYHNLKHTIDVITQVELIGRGEGVNQEEMLLLKTAALFHDTGFLIGYDDHELLSIKMSKEILPDFHYTEEQIKIICDLIFVTQHTSKPKTKLEEIMCDADLDYLGRSDFIPVSQKLFEELFEHKKIRTYKEWFNLEVQFIEDHRYYTKTAHDLREENKQKQLEELKKLI